MNAKERAELDTATRDDPLIQGLLDAKGEHVEIVAFGISYTGRLVSVDPDAGIIVVDDGENRAVLEIERIESFSLFAS